ncbi:hypothetical protein Tco_1419469 [Tanacetum coccineum]
MAGEGGGEDPSRPPPTSHSVARLLHQTTRLYHSLDFAGKGKRNPNLGRESRRKTRKGPETSIKGWRWPLIEAGPNEIVFSKTVLITRFSPTGPYSTSVGKLLSGRWIRSNTFVLPFLAEGPPRGQGEAMATLGIDSLRITRAAYENPSDGLESTGTFRLSWNQITPTSNLEERALEQRHHETELIFGSDQAGKPVSTRMMSGEIINFLE